MQSRFPALAQVALALILVLGVTPSVPSAAASQGTGTAQEIRTFVTLYVNTKDEGETVVDVRQTEVWVPEPALRRVGIALEKARMETFYGVRQVELSSLKPEVTYEIDLKELALRLTVFHKGVSDFDLLNNKPQGIVYTGGKSAYLNYALTSVSGTGTSGYFEGGIADDDNSFHYSFTAQNNSAFRRGLLYYQMDDRAALTRQVYGDLLAATGDLGGSMFLGGYGVARDFDLDPYFVRFPMPSLTGMVTSPSVADVYVNGILVKRVDLPPGAYNLNQLPVNSGSSNTQVIITNAFGQTQSYSQAYYAATNLLSAGTSDFQYAAGLLRQNAFAYGDSYGPAALVGRYSAGLTNWATVGGRFEATPYLVSGGPEVDLRSSLGYFHVGLAGSDDRGSGGAAASFGYNYTAPRYGFGVSLLGQGAYYANISQPPSYDRAVESLAAYANAQVGSASSLSLQYTRVKMRDTGTSSSLSVGDTITLPHGLSLVLLAGRTTSTTQAPSATVGATLRVTTGTRGASVTSQGGSVRSVNLEADGAPQGKYGISYFATYDPSYARSFSGTVNYATQYGNIGGDYASSAGAPFTDAFRLSGGLAFIDGGIYPTRPIAGSYALVVVPGTPNVDVYAQNQVVGKTDRNGKLLVPDLLPDYGNSVRIDDEDIPMNASIESVSKLIAPPPQAGSVVTFATQHVRALAGSVVVISAGKRIVPKYGQLDIDSARFHAASPLGENGEFYLDNVPPGPYSALVTYEDGECRFALKAPQTTAVLTILGTLACTVK